MIKKSTCPLVPAESTIFKKRKNYLAWTTHPEQVVTDIANCQARAVQAKAEYDTWERDEDRWAECMEIARTKLCNSYHACVGTNL